jgi:hypothetical protein
MMRTLVEALIQQNKKLFEWNELRQTLDFAEPCVIRRRWLAVKCGFTQRLPYCDISINDKKNTAPTHSATSVVSYGLCSG